uniref:TIGR00267 family protein n=1 Tax=Candidatus Methanosuratincola petrocarbonis (ex Vanwonterghem et al. 2016) TaxID=1867261 RepID=A0A7J3UZN7_9CREN
MLRRIRRFRKRARKYFSVAGAAELSRRYFVMNSFDGALAILGVVMGAYITGKADAHLIINSGIGLALATGISGFVGAFLSEKAERSRKIKEIEESIMMEIKDSIIYRASKFVTFALAVVDGISPALTIFLTLIPFMIHEISPSALSLQYAMVASIAINLSTLALLGIYLGKIASANRLKYSLLTVAMGLAIVAILFLTGAGV